MNFIARLCLVSAIVAIGLLALNWLVQRAVALVLVVLVLLLSGCTGEVPMPKPWDCHKAIRYAIYSKVSCVIYEA